MTASFARLQELIVVVVVIQQQLKLKLKQQFIVSCLCCWLFVFLNIFIQGLGARMLAWIRACIHGKHGMIMMHMRIAWLRPMLAIVDTPDAYMKTCIYMIDMYAPYR